MRYHLAENNLAWMRYPFEDPRMAGMRDEIDRINRLGDRSPGFVWRFETAAGDATGVRVLDDPRVLFNLTVWETVADLRRYVYRSEHVEFFRRRREWFLPPPREPVALWWVREGQRPGVDEAMARIERLWREGPTREAFNLKRIYGPDGAPAPPPAAGSEGAERPVDAVAGHGTPAALPPPGSRQPPAARRAVSSHPAGAAEPERSPPRPGEPGAGASPGRGWRSTE